MEDTDIIKFDEKVQLYKRLLAYQENLQSNILKIEECKNPKDMKLRFQAYYKIKSELERKQEENRYRFKVHVNHSPLDDPLDTTPNNLTSNTLVDHSKTDAKRVTFNLSNSIPSNHGTHMNPTLDQMTTYSNRNDMLILEANQKQVDRIYLNAFKNNNNTNTDNNSIQNSSPSKIINMMSVSNETFVQPNTMAGSMINIEM